MKTKQLKKYPIPVLMMTITFGLTLLLPYLSGYLIDNVLASYDEQKLWGWFGVTFLVAIVSMSFSFFSVTTTSINICLSTTRNYSKKR